MKTIAIDIDGTLRDLDAQIDKYLEQDHPHRVHTFRNTPARWDKLDAAFNGDRKSVENWLYGERAFHLFGQAPKMYPKVIEHLNAIAKMCQQTDGEFDLVISSVQRNQSITATLFWLSKNGCKVNGYRFFNSFEDKNDWHFDYVIDDHPGILEEAKRMGSIPIVVPHPYNEHLTVEDGFHRLNYEGDNPEGLAGIVDLVGLSTYQIIGD